MLIMQICCILVCLTGIIVEYMYGANLGFLLITGGSVIFAVSAKIENYIIKRRKE